jgi:hypothetical protein
MLQTVTRGVVAALSSQSTTDHDHRRGRVLIEPIYYRSRPPARSCTYRANLLQITTTGAVVYLSSQSDRSRPPARSCTYRANLLQITTTSPATTRLQSTSIRTVDDRGSALPAPDEPEIRAYFPGVGLFSYFSQSGFGQPLLFQYRILWQLLL